MPSCEKLTESRIFTITVFVALLTGCAQPEPEAPSQDAAITGDQGQASYTLGYAMGQSVLEQYPDELDIDAFASGMQDGMRGSAQQVAETDGRAALDRLLKWSRYPPACSMRFSLSAMERSRRRPTPLPRIMKAR